MRSICLDPYSIGILDRLIFGIALCAMLVCLDPYSIGILDRLKLIGIPAVRTTVLILTLLEY